MLSRFVISIVVCKLLLTMTSTDGSPAFANVFSSTYWAENGTTVVGRASWTSGPSPNDLSGNQGISISSDDTLYIADSGNNRIVIVPLGGTGNVSAFGFGPGTGINQTVSPSDVFVTDTAVYVMDSWNDRVQKWSRDGTNPVAMPGVPSISLGDILFVDRYDNLYLTTSNGGSVICIARNSNISVRVAGSGSPGSANSQLWSASGLWVDDTNAVYVLDSWNRRIQKWPYNASSGLTVAGTGFGGSSYMQLQDAHSLAIDNSGYMYTVDQFNDQVLRWAPNTTSGVCVVGCPGSGANQLSNPVSLAFDSNGSMYVSDSGNNRVKKFQILGNASQVPPTMQTTSKSSLATSQQTSTAATSSLTVTTSTTESTTGQITTMALSTTGQITAMAPLTTRPDQTTSDESRSSFDIRSSYTSTVATVVTSHTTARSSIPDSSIVTTAKISSTNRPSSLPSGERSSLISSTALPQTSISPTTQSTLQDCEPAIISLSPYYPNNAAPLEITRSEDFSISSSLDLHCLPSLSTIKTWTIESCPTSLCSVQVQFEQSPPSMTLGELSIPARMLSYGIYRMNLTVTMSGAPQLVSSATTYVKIVPSAITVRLIQFGAESIRRGQQQTLTLDPGTFSIDPDTSVFNSSNWLYTYFCGVYDTHSPPKIDSFNQSCFENASRSSLTIPGGSHTANRTYHFRAQLTNVLNSMRVFTGDLLVQVEDQSSAMIAVTCAIASPCVPKGEYQIINPTTAVVLMSQCIDDCDSFTVNASIEWTVNQGAMNVTAGYVQWTALANMSEYKNSWFFGTESRYFTATKDLFDAYPAVEYWHFGAVYSTTPQRRSVGTISFMVNTPPRNGTCRTDPLNGTTATLFTIICSGWFDTDGIKDYSFYAWTTDSSNRFVLADTTSTTLQIRMPITDAQSALLHLVVRVRDTLDCTTEQNFSSVSVTTDASGILNSIATLQAALTNSGNYSTVASDALVQSLYGGDQNTVCQSLTSLAQAFNLLQNSIPTASLTVSSLYQDDSKPNNYSWSLFNVSTAAEYKQQVNAFADLREYLMLFMNNLAIAGMDSIVLQATTLAQLTTATNQLTRNALTAASARCSQLASALLNIASSITAEQLQSTAAQIYQCASSVLTAANAPLQGRTASLDLDMRRANTMPTNGDADLESVWANPYLFADGNDFSSETIERNRNAYYQQQTATAIAAEFEKTNSMIADALLLHLNVQQHVIINTSSVVVSLNKTTADTLSNQTIQLNTNTHIRLPAKLSLGSTNNSTVTVRCVSTPLAVRGELVQANTNLSTSLSMSFLDESGNELAVSADAGQPIELFIPRDPLATIPSMMLQNVTSITNVSTMNNRQFNLHSFDITRSNDNLSVSLHLQLRSLNASLGYMLIYKFDGVPQLNSSIKQIDDWALLCPSNGSNASLLTYFIDNEKPVGHNSIIFGIRELNQTEFETSCENRSAKEPISDRPFNFSANYALRMFISGCYYLDADNRWRSDGLLVGPLTDLERTQCFSTHLTTFAGGFLVLPAPINWNYVFANADFAKNKTVYLTMILSALLYLVLSIYARYEDKKDAKKHGVALLSDNHPADRYFYQILVFTGVRKDAGTTSKVQFVLSGEDHDTGPRTLTDAQRSTFQRGSIDSFVVAVPKSLGYLNYMRIWHDNSGRGSSASWFLKYVIVRDLQTMEKSYFICQKWLAVEKNDGAIERLLPVASEYEKHALLYLLSKKAYRSLSDGHLWFSIFSRPPPTSFTRVQRCTCCFVLLYTAMLLNVLYYDYEKKASSETKRNGLSLGPFYFTREQIGIGLIIDVLIFIPSTLLVEFYRRIRRRQPLPTVQRSPANVESSKPKCSPSFPWWCVFIAYGLSFSLMILAVFLIIARGIEMGDVKVQKWLTSLATSFFSSVLLSQPVKVLCLAVFFALVTRQRDDHEENEDFYLDGVNEQLPSLQINVFATERRRTSTKRLSKTQVAKARAIRLRETRLWSSLRELVTYVCFLTILFLVSDINQNSHAHYQIRHLRNYFLSPYHSTIDYTKMSTVNEFWNWLEVSFVPSVRAQQWYNGVPSGYLSGFLNDRANRLIGWPVMRQLRASMNSSCRVPVPIRPFIRSCQDDYSPGQQERRSWVPGWTSTTNLTYASAIRNAYTYRSSNQLDSSDGSGGYIFELRGGLEDLKANLAVLHQLAWIDPSTRAILIQFSLYNPNVQLYTSVTFLIEFLTTGGVFPHARFDPIDLQNGFLGFSSLAHALCAIVYLIFITYFTAKEIRSLIRLKKSYFRSIWSFLEWSILLCSWTAVGLAAWRVRENTRLVSLFHTTHSYQYVNLQTAAYIDEEFRLVLGLCCFFALLKLLHVCRFHPRLSQISRMFHYASKDLVHMTMALLIVCCAFAILFYTLFTSEVWAGGIIGTTVTTLCKILLRKLGPTEMTDIGVLAVAVLAYCVFFVFYGMVFAKMNEAVRYVRRDSTEVPDDDWQLFSFVWLRMKQLIGLGTRAKENHAQRRDSVMSSAKNAEPLAITINKRWVASPQPPRKTTASTVLTNDICVENISLADEDD